MNGVILGVVPYSECIRFYRDGIGLEILMEKPGITRFQFGSIYLQIEDCGIIDLRPSSNITLRENVRDMEEKRRELRMRGISLEVHDLAWGEIGFAYDPHGTKVEYFREKPSPPL